MAENRELALVLKLVADQFQSELKKSQGALGQFNDFIKDWKTQLTAAGAALFAIAKSTANYGDELVKASQRMGVTIEETARLQHAAKISDTDLHGLSATVGFLSKEMVQAAAGNAEAVQKFEMLGISVRGSNSQLKGTTEILLELNDKFRLMPDGPEKTGQAMLVLGKSAKEVLPLLNSDLREAFKEADQLGLVMSEKDARAAEHFNDEITKLQGSIRGLTNDIGTALIPKFDAITHALTTIITDARKAGEAIMGLGKAEPPQVGVVKPEGGGRNLRIVPAPSKSEQDAFIPEPSGFVQRSQKEMGEALQKRFVMEEKIKESLRKQQEELGKAKQELFQVAQRSIDIENRLRTEGADIYRLQIDRQLQREKEDDAYQERLGKAIVEQTQLEVRIREEARAKKLQGLTDNLKAWRTYYDQVGGSAEFRYTNEMNLVRANLAQQLDLNVETAGRLVIAWQNKDEELAESILARTQLTATERETIELQTLAKIAAANQQGSEDILSGWSAGLDRYVRDTKSGFGMAADLARRTAGQMEQSFRTFFFDVWEGKITSLKDALTSLGEFAKQITGTVFAQLATKAVLGGFGFGANAGGMVQRFATGGPVLGTGNLDTVPALLTPGEFVLSRRDVGAITKGLAGGGVNIVVNNYSQTDVQASSQRGPDGQQMIYLTIRDAVRGMMQRGDLDGSMQRRWGMTPAPGRR